MQFRKLGGTDIDVSLICLGTMTWGSQNSEAEGHAQIDYALDQGINFLDTAEGYPVTPVSAETRGRTEEIIGTWLATNKRRDQIVLASKIAGPSRGVGLTSARGAGSRLDPASVALAIDGSLKRLQTDYIDLYQLHWPDRSVPSFGKRGLSTLSDPAETVPIADTLGALAEAIRAGKIRHVGVSNETPWGVNEFLRLARDAGLPRIVSIQNPYSLLNRVYETGLAEISLREDVGLLAYSPLAGGNLSGKYLGGVIPPGSRREVASQFTRYDTPSQPEATARYVALARKHGLDPSQMALAYVNDRAFVTSTIIGATSMEQLRTDIGSIDVTLSEEVVKEIEAIHFAWPDPCP